MRGLARLTAANPGSASRNPFFAPSSSHAYSTFAGSGRGRGRGAGSPPSPAPLGKPPHEDDDEAASGPPGLGHGRGQPPSFPSFSLNPTPPSPSATGRGRVSPPPLPRPPSPLSTTGRGRGVSPSPPPHSRGPSDAAAPKRPIFFRRDDYAPDQLMDPGDAPPLHAGLPFGLPPRGSIGRGKPAGPVAPASGPPEENRHLRPRSPPDQSPRRAAARTRPPALSSLPRTVDRDEAAKKAMDILSRGGRGQMGRGLRGGRGEGGGMGWRGRGGRFGGRGGRARDPDEYYGTGLYLGDNADGEKLAKRLGEENMGKLKEAFEEMSGRVLPSPMDDAYLDALNTNYSFEFEPEYHMELSANPDIDEKPPIPLTEALEKMKPFLIQYEGIASQEEWEEVMKETMEKVPILKEIVDFYSGPDRITAKQQHQELERVAKNSSTGHTLFCEEFH